MTNFGRVHCTEIHALLGQCMPRAAFAAAANNDIQTMHKVRDVPYSTVEKQTLG